MSTLTFAGVPKAAVVAMARRHRAEGRCGVEHLYRELGLQAG